ncbi:hypothetical protein FKM82_030534 [Ascaphus truei]
MEKIDQENKQSTRKSPAPSEYTHTKILHSRHHPLPAGRGGRILWPKLGECEKAASRFSRTGTRQTFSPRLPPDSSRLPILRGWRPTGKKFRVSFPIGRD